MASLTITEKQLSLLDEIQEELECVVCLDIPSSAPVFQCDHGHILCNSCHVKLVECPICKIKLGNTRCLAVEKILAKYPKSCEFHNYGCNIKLQKSDLDAHTEVCIYKPLKCPSLNCEKLFPIIDLLNHMDQDHGNYTKLEKSSFTASFPGIKEIIKNKKSFKFEPVCIKLDNRFFFSECWRTCKGRWYVWLYMLGTPNESKCYVFTAKIMNPDHVEELSYTGECVSLHVGIEQVGSVGRCLTFNDDTAKHFCFDDAVPVHIEVRRNPTAQSY